jgi:hypothetical protein
MSQPYEVFGSQNVRDDDGAVIDSFFIETDAPPDLKDAIEPIAIPEVKAPAPTTRLITGELNIDPAWGQGLLVPADANRKGLNIRVYSATAVATDGVRLSDDPGSVRNAGKVLHSGAVTFDNHTGPIYYYSAGATGTGAASATISVEYWSTTE